MTLLPSTVLPEPIGQSLTPIRALSNSAMIVLPADCPMLEIMPVLAGSGEDEYPPNTDACRALNGVGLVPYPTTRSLSFISSVPVEFRFTLLVWRTFTPLVRGVRTALAPSETVMAELLRKL